MTSSYPFAAAKWMIDGTEEIYLYMPLTPKLGLLRECPRYEPIPGKENFELFVTGTNIRDFHNFKVKIHPVWKKLYKRGDFKTRHQTVTNQQQVDYLNSKVVLGSGEGINKIIFPPICESSEISYRYIELCTNVKLELMPEFYSETFKMGKEIKAREYVGWKNYYSKTFKEEPNAEDNS